MTPKKYRISAITRWTVVVLALVLVMGITPMAYAMVDEFGGASFSAPYAPYTATKILTPQEANAPYAPYTAGPVVRETRPYAPYTAGPVVPEVRGEPPVNPRIGNFLEW